MVSIETNHIYLDSFIVFLWFSGNIPFWQSISLANHSYAWAAAVACCPSPIEAAAAAIDLPADAAVAIWWNAEWNADAFVKNGNVGNVEIDCDDDDDVVVVVVVAVDDPSALPFWWWIDAWSWAFIIIDDDDDGYIDAYMDEECCCDCCCWWANNVDNVIGLAAECWGNVSHGDLIWSLIDVSIFFVGSNPFLATVTASTVMGLDIDLGDPVVSSLSSLSVIFSIGDLLNEFSLIPELIVVDLIFGWLDLANNASIQKLDEIEFGLDILAVEIVFTIVGFVGCRDFFEKFGLFSIIDSFADGDDNEDEDDADDDDNEGDNEGDDEDDGDDEDTLLFVFTDISDLNVDERKWNFQDKKKSK